MLSQQSPKLILSNSCLWLFVPLSKITRDTPRKKVDVYGSAKKSGHKYHR